MKTYPLLRELSSALILAVSQQFNNSALIRGKTSDLLDDVADESGALGEVTFSSGDARLWLDGFDFLKRKLIPQKFDRSTYSPSSSLVGLERW